MKHIFPNVLMFILFTNINSTCSHRTNSYTIPISKEYADFILCRKCGLHLADSKDIINHLSPDSTVIVNQTLFERDGVEVQLLKNPLGIKFHSITLADSKCSPVHNWQHHFSWYPGYAWRPCICKRCRTHHGWIFEPIETANLSTNLPTERGFFLLKLDTLLSETFANSLIVVPKSYSN